MRIEEYCDYLLKARPMGDVAECTTILGTGEVRYRLKGDTEWRSAVSEYDLTIYGFTPSLDYKSWCASHRDDETIR